MPLLMEGALKSRAAPRSRLEGCGETGLPHTPAGESGSAMPSQTLPFTK